MHPWMSIWPPVCLSTCLLLSLPLALPVYVMQAGLHEGVNSSGIRAAHHTALCVTASNRLLEYLVDPFFFTSVLKAHEERLNGSLENEIKSLQSLQVKSEQISQNWELRNNRFGILRQQPIQNDKTFGPSERYNDWNAYYWEYTSGCLEDSKWTDCCFCSVLQHLNTTISTPPSPQETSG